MHSRVRRSTILSALFAVTAGPLVAQQAPTPAQGGRGGGRSGGAAAVLTDSALVNSLPLRSIGPAVMSGRVVDIAVAESPGTRGGALGTVAYLAAATGGIWKTTNAGVTWAPVFDQGGNVASTGDVTVAPSNSNIVWVGSGEANNMRSSSWGDGVYKSTDGGATWQHMGLKKSQHIGRIVIHPKDPNTVYVAAVGALWGPGGERGLFKTTDGGKTWTNTKSIDANTGFTDLAMDPTNPDVLYATSLQRERRAYGYVGGGPESGIWKTTDGAKTWTRLTEGFSTAPVGRVGIDICRSQPTTLYAVAEGREAGVYRSDDAGASWRRASNLASIPWFFGQIRCNPQDPEKVIHLGVSLQESTDGGRTWANIGTGTHSDHHALWIDPENPDHMLLGNDGGFYSTRDHGKTWDFSVDLPISQFYAIGIDFQEPFYGVYGGLQDNSTWGGPNQTRHRTGVTNFDWFRMAGGDGFYAAVDPTDHNIAYVESQEGALLRFDARTGEGKGIRPQVKPGEAPLRFNWSAPVLISKHDNRTIYFAAQYLFRSPDRGDSWTQLGGDLTRKIDRNTLPMMGKVPATDAVSRNEGVTEFGNISTIDESPTTKGVLIVGTDDGIVQITRDDGKTWTKVDRWAGVPDTTYVSRVVASRTNGTFYVTLDGHRSNDFKPYVMKTTDYGRSWTSMVSNLPEGSVHVLREHHRNGNLLFVGTEYAPYVSLDGGGSWTRIRNGLPPVPVHDIVIHPRDNDLILGTHGRGMWIMDDIAPLEGLATAKGAAIAHLFPVESATQYSLNNTRSLGSGARSYSGANPPVGVAVSYLLKSVPQGGTVKLSIVDASGAHVRELPAPSRAGLQRVTWDMRVDAPYAGPRVAAAAAAGGRAGGAGGGGAGATGGAPVAGGGGTGGRAGGAGADAPNVAPAGPLALPGQYKARLTVAGGQGAPAVMEQAFTLRKDAMVTLTDAELKQLYDLRVNVAQLQAKLTMALRNADDAKATLAEARTAIRSMTPAPEAVSREADALNRELDDIIAKLRGAPAGGRGGGAGGGAAGGPPAEQQEEGAPPRPAGLAVQQRLGTASGINGSNSMPTQYQREALTDVPADLDRELQRLNTLMQKLPAFMASLDAAGVPWTTGRPVKTGRDR